MDFGKLSNINFVDWRLPADPESNTRFLKSLKKPEKPQLYFASPVWSNAGFVGKIYPHTAKPANYLYHYARQFNCIELNTTYYGVNPASVAKWVAAAPESFKFCPKLTKRISHEKQLRLVDEDVQEFCQQMEVLGNRLGPAWLLLPQSFGPWNLDELSQFLTKFPKKFELGVELRHPEWFDEQATGEVFNLFEKNGTAAIITDVAGRRDVLHMRLTSPTTIIRFVGNHLHPTDFERLDEWAHRIAKWFEQGLHTCYIFLHQPEEELCVELAIHFVNKLNELAGLDVQVPQLVPPIAEQGSLF
jgi:uncharacterized protein YecE (DUF72 family)